MTDTIDTEQHNKAELGAEEYKAEQIKVLKGLEAVRKRPGMYIGDTDDGTGLHHMVFEVVDNSIDEAIAGYCSQIDVTVHNDDSVTVEDNGRGIPVDMHPEEHRSAAEVIMTVLHAGGKFDHSSYKVSGGLHGVGVSVVNALSEQLILEIYRGGKVYRQEYSKGDPLAPLAEIGTTSRTGTKVTFKPDRTVFKLNKAIEQMVVTEEKTPVEEDNIIENDEELAEDENLSEIESEIKDVAPSDVVEEDKTDDSNVGDNIFKGRILMARLRQLAYLNAGVKITFTDERDPNGKTEVYCFKGGIREYVRHINENRKVLNDEPIYIYEKDDNNGVIVEACLQWNDGYNSGMENTPVYTNNIRNKDGGTHLTGLRLALTNVFTNYIKDAKDNDIKKKTQKFVAKKSTAVGIKGEDVREGLVCVLSVKMPDPKFSSQTKDKLISSEIQRIVSEVVSRQLGEYFHEHPDIANPIIEKSKQAAQVREAVRKTQEMARAQRKNYLDDADLPGKLTDCRSNKPEECELFLVEGLSAGGSAINGRNSLNQAVLPLRGKILNVEKARLDRMLSSQEIKVLIKALGTGIGSEVDGMDGFDISKLRYHKVVIMTDADVDGSHIRTLLLTFFFRQMPELIKAGHVYIAQPPLFKVSYGTKKVKINGKVKEIEDCVYFKDENERDRMLWAKASQVYKIRVEGGEPEIYTQDDLLRLFQAYGDISARLSKMDHFLDKRVMEGILYMQDKQHPIRDISEEMIASIKDYLATFYPNLQADFEISNDEEHNSLQAMAYLEEDGMRRECHMGYNFFHSPEFAELLQLNEALSGFRDHALKLELADGAKSSFATASFVRISDLLQFAIVQVTAAQKISRYKGLGEMSPEQLKETTMDPANRTMLCVTIEDAEEADRTFSLLMGDAVEPRREFIEQNARFVLNLDI